MTDYSNLSDAAASIRCGGLVAFPTETVYGLGADAMNAVAVARIFDVKRRPFFDPLIVHVADMDGLALVLADANPLIARLAEGFWPGPLTIVARKNPKVPDIVTSGLDTVAVRWPRHPIAQRLIELAETPIAAPSANRFGKTSPTTAEHVREQLDGEVDIVLDGGPCSVGIESTIISLAGSAPLLLRHGGIPKEDIERVIGPVCVKSDMSDHPGAPGMLARHYATHTPMAYLGEEPLREGCRLGLLSFRGDHDLSAFQCTEILSPGGDLREAATNLFGAMRRLDKCGLDAILTEKFPDRGLGRAINDRLAKACASFSFEYPSDS